MTKNNAVILYKMLYRKILTLRQKYGIIDSYGFTVYGGVYRSSQVMARSHFSGAHRPQSFDCFYKG